MWDFIKNNWIALVALAISVLAFFKDIIRDAVNHNKSKKDSNSAKLTACFINKKLIISNKGQSDANNIKIYIDDHEIQNDAWFSPFAKEMDFSVLSPGNSITIGHISTFSTPSHFKIKLMWEDKNSKYNKFETVINI